jgi:hypothetical protein
MKKARKKTNENEKRELLFYLQSIDVVGNSDCKASNQ